MADDRDEEQQTEEPTQKRLDQAREHGDVIQSAEVTTLILLLGGTLSVAMFAQNASIELSKLFRTFIAEPDQIGTDGASLKILMGMLLMKLLIIIGPMLGFMMLSGIVANVLQHRPTFSFEKLKPNLNKLNPISGFGRMFGKEGLVNIIKGILKIAIVGAAIWFQVWPERALVEASLTQSPGAVAGDMSHLFFKVMLATLCSMLLIAGVDYLYQYMQFMKRNRMSKQEIKEEFKQTEGDPHVKGKLKQMRMEKAKRRMIAAVPKATVVITNPTHFAVALYYESGKTQAPVCVAKGTDALALRIREVAKQHEVPIVENPPLARALYATIEVDDPIPSDHYKAVAQVISYVMKLTGKIRAN
ncbi:flagellar biosynthetic protein FlhB [Rhizomicrobium palustre]|uniref:Flagellar biosynthetic protein FlhB n=1 Tax=Rhizomicrobium palustre TaxID=189966 RepID=A0A846MYZ0_9PROT|nr:flagellar biosynthetic protein FlhB [Rhizomicrobium palustre]